ncbi:MAG: class I mannose-6-phosphate isomerase [Micrococcales bacterium]|nr:class I mannose-6-phosphate isomerase [Micrococcales bacterium]
MPVTALLLRPDNFTPPSRTPWGGRRILEHYKRGLPLDPSRAAYPVVGESWEISVEPDFPSRVDGTDAVLGGALAADPRAWLGARAAGRYGTATPLLVKLLDAADDLSVQIHPGNDYAGLGPGESGKPESWYVVERAPGAGIYLGLSDGVGRDEVARALAGGGDLTPMLNFVPVEPGDFFVIDAGTVHAIGRGVTLVEPQVVLPARRGVTYRFWDWNRRYDPDGRLDPNGAPRTLHAQHALAVTPWDGPRGAAFVAQVRPRPTPLQTGPARHDRLHRSEVLAVDRVQGTGTVRFETADELWGLTVLAGTVRVRAGAADLEVSRGWSAVLPAALGATDLHLADAHAILTCAH